MIIVGYPGGIEEASASFQAKVDTAAGEARLQYITSIPAQDATYTAKLGDAKLFVANGMPEEYIDSYPWLKGEMETYDLTASEACNNILAMAHMWETVGVQIEKIRLKAKKAIREASSVREMHTIATTAIQQLSEI
ncbi:MAG: hypothetical protein HC888_00850 [Candidatus Competibacteraceae bacterium]|nr:hypothetical protein [Candidatus Competibacteraceae bacterium]